MIDMRSDTCTKPTDEMRQAIAKAVVGDDVLCDDPTVKQLERRTAEILGLEAALYMPSGTMSNQIAVRTHTEPGNEIFLHEKAHMYYFEVGAAAALSGVTCNLLTGERGVFSAATLNKALRPKNIHYPKPALVCIENTHNRCGGTVWDVEQLAEVSSAAHEKGLKTHLDGARLFNAAAALGVPEKELACVFFDSVSVCFSKGLGAPVGSCLAGSSEFIERARFFRKMFGGGMRQAGIIAAGALYALDNHRNRLTEDHENAKLLARSLAEIDGVEIDLSYVETNIVIFKITTMPASVMIDRLTERNILMSAISDDMIRAVTSLMVNSEDAKQAGQAIGEILQDHA